MKELSLSRTDEEWEALYQRNVEAVYRICYLYLKNPADAEDAVQSVFLKYLRSPVSFREREHEKAWFLTTAKNHCKDILKSWWKRRRVDWASLPEAAGEEGVGQEQEAVEKLLALPEKYRAALYLYYLEGYSTREIAQLLGRKESTVRTQLLRGRERLRQELGEGGEDFA